MRPVVGLATVVLALGVGCGNGDDEDTVAPEAFQREVNALCEDEHTRVDAMFETFPEEPTPSDVQDFIGRFAESFREYRDGLVAVGPPEGRASEYDEYVELVDAHLEDLEAGAADADEAQRLFNEEGEDPLADLETELGLDVCASR